MTPANQALTLIQDGWSLAERMALKVPMPLLAVQQTFNRVQAEVAALKAKHTATRQANAAQLPATLERVLAASQATPN